MVAKWRLYPRPKHFINSIELEGANEDKEKSFHPIEIRQSFNRETLYKVTYSAIENLNPMHACEPAEKEKMWPHTEGTFLIVSAGSSHRSGLNSAASSPQMDFLRCRRWMGRMNC